MIHILDLTVTQSGFRNERQIQDMVGFVAEGGKFNLGALAEHNGQDLRLINIVKFEDGRLFIHDGHHRVAAIYLGGRKFIFGNEYFITEWKYSQYLEVNFDLKWVTPFDPRIEVRIPDYDAYKRDIFKTIERRGEGDALLSIKQQHAIYTRPRTALTIQDLLSQI